MILIADSGSTKTDWLLADAAPRSGHSDELCPQDKVITTQGMNPFHQTEDQLRNILREELLKQLDQLQVKFQDRIAIDSVWFYGSGVRPELEAPMCRLLGEAFPSATVVEAHNDLLGAARALCGRDRGIACILGTGANSCLYDGERIVENTPPLGYILGDEGSGAVLGRRFLNALYKGVLSKEIVVDFEHQSGLTMADVIDRVYRKPLANRFLASLCPYIRRRLDDEAVSHLVSDAFRDFFRLNIGPYGHPQTAVHFVGSVAWYFADQLRAAADSEGYVVGTIARSPLPGLCSYHACLTASS